MALVLPGVLPAVREGMTMVQMIPFRLNVGDGVLSVSEFSELPFTPKRMFWVSGMSEGIIRGNHAHRKCHQLIVAIAGSFTVEIEEGPEKREFFLNDSHRGDPSPALHVPPLTWVTISKVLPYSVILVLASDEYDIFDYIDSRDEWLKLWEANRTVEHHAV